MVEEIPEHNRLDTPVCVSFFDPSLPRMLLSLITNIYFWFVMDRRKMAGDKKYIHRLHQLNNIDNLESILKANKSVKAYDSIIRTHKLLDTVRQNTKKVLTCNGDDHKDYDNITKYVSGYCLFNARLSHGISIPPADQAIIDSIDRVVNKVEPLNEPVCLFHGFEKYMHYTIQDNKVNVPGILSKTISLNVEIGRAHV